MTVDIYLFERWGGCGWVGGIQIGEVGVGRTVKLITIMIKSKIVRVRYVGASKWLLLSMEQPVSSVCLVSPAVMS